jgi:hypothetical protein
VRKCLARAPACCALSLGLYMELMLVHPWQWNRGGIESYRLIAYIMVGRVLYGCKVD